MFMKHYAPNRCEPSIEVIMKMGVQWGWGSGVLRVEGGQGGCEYERRIEVIVKIQCGCERRIKNAKKKKKKKNGGGGGVWTDVNEKLKNSSFCENGKKIKEMKFL